MITGGGAEVPANRFHPTRRQIRERQAIGFLAFRGNRVIPRRERVRDVNQFISPRISNQGLGFGCHSSEFRRSRICRMMIAMNEKMNSMKERITPSNRVMA